MPIRRKICKIGTGLAVFLPKSWVQLLEEKHGPVEAVTIEVDSILTITPILKENSASVKPSPIAPESSKK
jgi:antitoxin component of MazEF toxin-antitoxin module